MKKKIKYIAVRHILLVLGIVLAVGITEFSGIGCPVSLLLKVPCPTCGVTRAMISLCKLDFAGYWQYQPMALPLCAAVWLMLNLDLFKRKKIITGSAVAAAALNLILWAVKLI